MYPSDFEDLYLLNLQGHLNHLSPDDKMVLTTAVNLWTRNLVIRQRFKQDYTVIDSPRAVTFRDRYGVHMIMRFNEIHKFSDGTLQQIDEELDYRVKELELNKTNPRDAYKIFGRRKMFQKQGVHVGFQKRLKDSNVEILLKMNLPDHRSVLTDPEDQAKMEMETPRSSGVNSPPNAHLMFTKFLLLKPALKTQRGDTAKGSRRELTDAYPTKVSSPMRHISYHLNLRAMMSLLPLVPGTWNLSGSDRSLRRMLPWLDSGARDEGRLSTIPVLMGEVTTAAYAWMIQENMTLTVDEKVIPEEPVSLQGRSKTSSIIPPMTSPVIDPVPRPDSPNVHWPLPTTTTTTAAPTTTTTTTLPLPPQPQQGSSDSILIKRMGELEQHIADLRADIIDSREIDRKINDSVKEVVSSSVKHAMRAPLRARFKDLPTSDMKEILLQRMLRRNKKKSSKILTKPSHGSPPHQHLLLHHHQAIRGLRTTRPPILLKAPPHHSSSSTHQGEQSTSTAAPSSSKTAASAEYSAWTTTDTRIKPLITTIPDDLYMDDETTAYEQADSSGDEVGRDHIPTVNLRQSWWKPLTEDRPASPELVWTIPSYDLPVPTNNWASALKTTYVPPPENSLLA
ncbi:hypothetical protein Tco_0852999 [Tanacetum coccineum]